MSKFSSPFMAKSPLKYGRILSKSGDVPEMHIGDPNFEGPTDIGPDWAEDKKNVAIEAHKKIASGDENAIGETIDQKVILSKGAYTPYGLIPTITTTAHDLAMQTDSEGNYIGGEGGLLLDGKKFELPEWAKNKK